MNWYYLTRSAGSVFTVAASVLSLIGSMIIMVYWAFVIFDVSPPSSSASVSDLFLTEKIMAQIVSQQKAFEIELNQKIESILDQPSPSGSSIELRFKNVDRRFEAISEKLEILTIIETAVTDNPERAMSIPILRKDVDLLRRDIVGDLVTIRAEIDRVYDLGKWFLGLIATMAIGVLGLAIGNLIKKSEKEA